MSGDQVVAPPVAADRGEGAPGMGIVMATTRTKPKDPQA